MTRYAWTCQVCSASNPPGSERCSNCDSPAQLSTADILRLRHELYPECDVAPLHGPLYIFLSRPRGWLPVSYGFLASATLAQGATCGGDMCGISAILPALLLLPWSLLSLFASVLSGTLANMILVLGLVANIYALHRIGKRCDRAKKDA